MFKRLHDEREVLNGKFVPKIHKETFVNYLEVVILEDGTIEYATPSHIQKAERVICERESIDKETLITECPKEYYADFNTWLCIRANLIMVWNDFYLGEPNFDQTLALITLAEERLFLGTIDVDYTSEKGGK